MKFSSLKLMLTALFGFALMGLSQISFAGWNTGDCSSVSGSAPCIEYQDQNGNWYHFNGSGGHSGVGNWHNTPTNANPSDADFEFCGDSELTCSFITADCTLCLSGEVEKFQDDNGDWRIGVQIESSSVTGGDTCDRISLSSFSWYAGDNNRHTGYGSDTGVPYNGGQSTYTGSVGTLDVNHSFLGTLVDQGHIHDVVYSNSNSSFDFNGTLYEDGSQHTDSGCSVDGNLVLQNGQDLNIL